MSYLSPAAAPPGRTSMRWAVDVGVTIAAGATALPYLFRDANPPRPQLVGLVVLAVIVAPLGLRRAYPVPVLAWMLCASIAGALWDDRVVAGFAVVIALYTVSASQPRKVALIATAAVELAAIGVAIYVGGWDFWDDSLLLSFPVAAAAGLGLYAGTRRVYLAELHDRAERLERERNQQGALAAAAERARIAREMHDVLAHHLTVMVALSDGAIAATATSPEQGIEAMRTVSSTGRRALADTRRLLGVLRDPADTPAVESLQPVPDLAGVDGLLEQVRSAGLATSYEVHGSAPELPAGIQLTVYRLIQEALTNTLKHAGVGAHAAVRLRYLPDELRVDIVDDGTVDAARNTTGAGRGLTGMAERVHAYGGDITAGPDRPGGWRVSARLRLDGGEIG